MIKNFLVLTLLSVFIISSYAYGREIAIRRAVASSTEKNNREVGPDKAFDGDMTTRWASNWADSQWIYFDLGERKSVALIKIYWEEAYTKKYKVQVSDNASDWRTIFEEQDGDGGEDSVNTDLQQTRYIRIYCIKRGTEWGNSMYEFKVFAADSQPPSAPSGVEATAGDYEVVLEWSDNYEDDLQGYNVYRKTGEGQYKKINFSVVKDSQYNDKTVDNGKLYHYYIKAVDYIGNESPSSVEVKAKTSFTDKGEKTMSSDEQYEALFSLGNLHELEVIFSQNEWSSLLRDIGKNLRTDKYRKARFICRGPMGKVVIEDVGFRIRGGTSRRTPQEGNGKFQKAHFKIKFDCTFDMKKGSEEYKKRGKREFANMRALNLKWVRENEIYQPNGEIVISDKTQIRELYSYVLLNRAGVITSKAGSAALKITVNGVTHDFGIYTIIEPIDKRFLAKRFGKDQNKGNLYKCLWWKWNAPLEPIRDSGLVGIKDAERQYLPVYDLKTNKKSPNHSVLHDFIKNLNSLSGTAFVNYMDTHFEVDRFLRYLAINFLVGNPDDYRGLAQNYYLYFNNKGKIEFIPFDYDHCFGAEWNQKMETLGIYEKMSYPREWDNFGSRKRPLVDKMFQIQKYRNKYEEYLKKFIDPETGIFTYKDFKKTFDMLYPVYKPHLGNEMHQAEWMENDETTRTVDTRTGGVRSVKYYYELKINGVKKDLHIY
ncbi:MAG: CotH kinase family protein [Elusimicrobia bacterium]|nr:CotH kinase family protein [Elusimicrobiota bacterium]